MLKKTAQLLMWNIGVTGLLLFIFEFGLRWHIKEHPNLEFLRFMPAELRISLIKDPGSIIELHGPNKRFEDDVDVGWIHKPGRVIKTRSGDQLFESRVNANGIHTPDDPPYDQEQLVVIGDSFLEGTRTTKPIAWQLRDLLGLPVYNLATGGWGPGNYLNAYSKYGAGRNSPVVVVFSFVNDFTDAEKFAEWERSGKKVSYWNFKTNARWYAISGNKGERWLDLNSVLYNMLKFSASKAFNIDFGESRGAALHLDRLKKVRKAMTDSYEDASYSSEILNVAGVKTKIFLKLNENRYFLICDPEDFDLNGACTGQLEDYEQYLDQLKQQIESSGGRMLLVWIPTRERMYYPFLEKARQEKYGKVVGKEGLAGIEVAIRRYAGRSEIAFLDLTEPLAGIAHAYLEEGELLYFDKDGHFNENGVREVARIVANKVRSMTGGNSARLQ